MSIRTAAALAKQTMLLTIVCILGVMACDACSGTTNSGSSASANQPALIAIYCFNAGQFTNPQSTVTVTFTGQGPGANDKLSVMGNSTVTSGDPHVCVTARVTQPLTKGNWTVTATPDGFGAPAKCVAAVPGIVTLDVSGASLSCRQGV